MAVQQHTNAELEITPALLCTPTNAKLDRQGPDNEMACECL